MQVNRKEALRYLGVRGEPDEKTNALLDQCIPQLMKVAVFRHILQPSSIRITGDTIIFPGFAINSAALMRHIKGCEQALLFTATLGTGVDRLMQAFTAANLPAAAALQACAASLLEDACDEVISLHEKDYAADGLYLKPRFSPGYGDFNLNHQPEILRVLDAQKRIGLFCTKNNMLTPTKSITAVIGVSPKPCGKGKGCSGCDKADCAFKKE